MKALTVIILLTFLLAGCGTKETEDSEATSGRIAELANDRELYTVAAENLVDQYSAALRTALVTALEDNGPAYALNVCASKAPEITAAHSTDSWSVKRVSERWRNAADRPDTIEQTILATFADPTTQDDFLVRWTGEDSVRTFHYYKKIIVGQMCLQCHGDLQTFDLDLYQRTKIRYPWDKATGYKEGDLRGMFVVEADWPGGKDLARSLAEGANITDVTAPDTTTSDPLLDTAAGPGQ